MTDKVHDRHQIDDEGMRFVLNEGQTARREGHSFRWCFRLCARKVGRQRLSFQKGINMMTVDFGSCHWHAFAMVKRLETSARFTIRYVRASDLPLSTLLITLEFISGFGCLSIIVCRWTAITAV